LFWQVSYTLAHSVDDASADNSEESVNAPPASQNTFDRKESRGPSDFDIRHNFVANVAYDLPGSGGLLGGWQISAVANAHSGVPFPQRLPSTIPDWHPLIIPDGPALVGIPTQASAQMAPKLARRYAGLIRGHLRYRQPVSLAMPGEISCGGRRSRNLTQL